MLRRWLGQISTVINQRRANQRIQADPKKEAMRELIAPTLRELTTKALCDAFGGGCIIDPFKVEIQLRLENSDGQVGQTLVHGWAWGRVSRDKVEVDFQMLVTATHWKAELIRIEIGAVRIREITFQGATWQSLHQVEAVSLAEPVINVAVV